MKSEEAIKRLVSGSDKAPHRAIIWISVEVHEVTKYGECGDIKHKIERFPLCVDGMDKFIAIRKVNEVLEELKEKCKKQS